jgi:dTDP-4-amino-4,6-dideoxygalactose transaminase
MNNHVPFMDLITPHRQMEAELVAVVRDALQTGRFIGGPMVEGFEQEFARFCGTNYCVGVGSGTDALRFALLAAGVKPGDMVITVPFTFIATGEAITQAGARPAFVDIDAGTCTMDPAKLRQFLELRCLVDATGRSVDRETGCPVTAVVPVHLYGQTADMNSISEIAEQYRLLVIEDACQAHGASCHDNRTKKWKKAGSLGKAAAFSFYPGKNLGACGEAGAVTTDDREVANNIRMLRDHGQVEKYVHTIEGYNGRLDAIQAGMLRVKLRQLPEWNERRRQIAFRYKELLSGISGVTFPEEPSWARSVYHVYAIRFEKRAELQSFLSKKNIATGLHYPIPLHLQQAYVLLGYTAGQFPVSEKTAREVLSLPMFPGLREDQQLQIAESIREFSLARPAVSVKKDEQTSANHRSSPLSPMG